MVGTSSGHRSFGFRILGVGLALGFAGSSLVACGTSGSPGGDPTPDAGTSGTLCADGAACDTVGLACTDDAQCPAGFVCRAAASSSEFTTKTCVRFASDAGDASAHDAGTDASFDATVSVPDASEGGARDAAPDVVDASRDATADVSDAGKTAVQAFFDDKATCSMASLLTMPKILVHDAAELAAMTAGNAYELANDIALTQPWKPVADMSYNAGAPGPLRRFVLDGKGHTIDGMTSPTALTMGTSLLGGVQCGYLHDLKFTNVSLACNGVTPGSQRTAIAGTVAAAIAATLVEDVHVLSGTVACTGPTSSITGGLFGVASWSTVRRSSNAATVLGGGEGGVIGRVSNWEAIAGLAGPVFLEDVTNTGNVTYVDAIDEHGGGIVGRSSRAGNGLTLLRVRNTGTITNVDVGGLVGIVEDHDPVTITDSSNAGNVVQIRNPRDPHMDHAGPYVGWADPGEGGYTTTNVTNTGTVTYVP